MSQVSGDTPRDHGSLRSPQQSLQMTMRDEHASNFLQNNHSFSLSIADIARRRKRRNELIDDPLEVTINNNSFVNFKKRRQYDTQPLIPTEVYQSDIQDDAVFLEEGNPRPARVPSSEAINLMEDPKPHTVHVPSNAPDNDAADGEQPDEDEGVEETSPTNDRLPVLIYPLKIDNMYRFRILYAGLCLFIVSSLQGLHSIFGLLLLDQRFRYSLTASMNIYTCGAAFGMFVLPFGVLYDFFGPRPGIAIATTMMLAAELCLAFCFKGMIDPTPTKVAILYGLMSWGCYALDVTVLPAVLTHMPRDRGQPTGLLKTFSGLGASFISCLYRGFFNRTGYTIEDNFSALFWFCFTLTAMVGIVSVWYMHDAPYLVTRAQRMADNQVVKKKLNKEKKEYTAEELEKNDKKFNEILKRRLKMHLIRNRYMAQLMPKRRYMFITLILVLLNFFLTIQAICAAFFAANMTPGKYRGMAIGAIVIVASLAILVVPVRAIDEPSPQDEEVIQRAKKKEEKLLDAKEERAKEEYIAEKRKRRLTRQMENSEEEEVILVDKDSRSSGSKLSRRQETTHLDTEAALIELEFNDITPLVTARGRGGNSPTPGQSGTSHPNGEDDPLAASISLSASVKYNKRNRPASPKDQEEEDQKATKKLEVVTHPYSTYDNPYIETINVCGEVYVAPIYQTNFFKSLTYIDIYLLCYTTFIIWGVGLTTTANYNIYIMLMARNQEMDYKMYILFSAMSGVFVAGGRVFIGVWERVATVMKQKRGIYITATATYPLCSILMLIGTVLWAALPGKYILVMSYLFTSAAYGASTSITPYVITAIFQERYWYALRLLFPGGRDWDGHLSPLTLLSAVPG
ncbi:Major Facilitator Superfamily, putative [Angomonas deanei]|uniref:Major Facilitator Superfamily, putative n=1 Tax=Angomonas deanei TaxID=59799 RepID=A0A7G2C2U0_9TRYP|nr:Major Facilitator Superfamily, putative [Angomonas deanei]